MAPALEEGRADYPDYISTLFDPNAATAVDMNQRSFEPYGAQMGEDNLGEQLVEGERCCSVSLCN